MAFSMPSVCCSVRARGSAEAGRRDTLKEYPRLMASSSVINVVNMAMKTGQHYTFLRDFIFTHPSMGEGLNFFVWMDIGDLLYLNTHGGLLF